MKKEDILEKSRNENREGDELDKITQENISKKSNEAMVTVLLIAGVLALFDMLKGTLYLGIIKIPFSSFCLFIIFLGELVQSSYRYSYSKKRKYLWKAIFYLVGLGATLYSIIK